MAETTKEPTGEKPPIPGNGNHGSFTISGRMKSFRNALHGMALMLKSQHNAWLHAFATLGVVIAGLVFGSDAVHREIFIQLQALLGSPGATAVQRAGNTWAA